MCVAGNLKQKFRPSDYLSNIQSDYSVPATQNKQYLVLQHHFFFLYNSLMNPLKKINRIKFKMGGADIPNPTPA